MKNIIYISICIFLLVACNNAEKPTDVGRSDSIAPKITIEEDRLKLLGIESCPVVMSEVNTTVNSPGKVVILSQYQSSVTPRINGTVEKIMVLEGQKIQKGQLLLTISSNEFIQLQETFLTTRSELEFIKADFDRQRKLREENVIGEKDFQLIKAKYQTLQARMRAAEANLRMLNVDMKKLADEGEISPYLEIYAPISGYLLTLPSTIGMSATATTELAHIISLDKLHADIFVYEKDIDQVLEEQEVDIEFVNQSIPKTKGRVEFIGRGIDPVKRTIVVHAVFLSPKGNVLPDMTLKATFKGTRSMQLTIPSAAVIRDGNAEYVYVKQANNAFMRADITIKGGDDDTVFIEPTAQLKEGTNVVCKGSLLIDGAMKKDGMEE